MAVVLLALLFSLIPLITNSQNVYVATPNAIRLGVEERIAIAVDGVADPQNFELYVQDHPGKRKNLTHTYESVLPANPILATIKIDPADIQDFEFADPSVRNYVSLTVHSKTFHKEVILPLSYKSGYIFLQTDKPIYTPQELVKFRIIPLDDAGKSSSEKVRFQIRNAKGIPVLDKEFSGKTFIVPDPYKFPSYTGLGIWSATVLYGYKYLQNATVQFEVQEYVLPTFTVKLKTQEVISPTDEVIPISVVAKYVYGKPVTGKVTIRLGVKGEAPNAIYFGILNTTELGEGVYKTEVYTSLLKRDKRIGWFPEIEGSKFVIEATVTEDATGHKEMALDTSGHFSSSPFIITFKESLRDFKPGLVSIIKADITFVDGRPVSGIRAQISATSGAKNLKITNPVAVSDKNGKVSFEVHPEVHHTEIDITVTVYEKKSESIGHHKQYSFISPNNAYIAITRNNKEIPKPGKMFSEVIYYEPEQMTNIYVLVVSKGKIELIKKMDPGIYKMQTISFMVTQEMVPSFRIVAFAEYKNDLIADSLRIDVANECDPKTDIQINPVFAATVPGRFGNIVVEGTKSTAVGLLAVDSAVYALADRDRLTRSKMFQILETRDFGCGPGGGLTTNSVLRDAGIVMVTKHYNPAEDATVTTCKEKIRKKRQVISSKLEEYKGTMLECCGLGISHDKYNRDCDVRAEIVKRHLGEDDGNCSKVFLDCCTHGKKNDLTHMKLAKARRPTVMAKSGSFLDKLEFIPTEEEQEMLESGAPVRNEFSETWIFDTIIIGNDGKGELPVSLPDSITTWIIQAVAVSPAHGMCVAEPKTVVSFKNVFIQLNLPYSVVRNEQIELRATVFNYGDTNLKGIVYMYGAKDLCSSAQEGEKSERKRVVVPPHSGQTISFPVIPLVEDIYDIQVVALTSEGSDVVHGKLNVVAEGYKVVREVATIKLDPSNQQRRPKRHITTDVYSDSIDDSQNLQVTAINLKAQDDFIPGTESCTISALGDQFGPTVQTSLENPDKLIDKPRGCAEQAMIYLAPTLYTMKYLKSANKITPDRETKGYNFIREGYDLILTYRKNDGSYGAWITTPSSTWLTAFIIKVFCQASQLVHISEEVMNSGLKWLLTKQHDDGSFIEHHPVYHIDMMGGVKGKVPLTAFVLITLQECNSEIPDLHIVKARAMSYLEDHLGDISEALPVAITAYALSLADSELKTALNNKLLNMATYDEDANMLHWQTGSNAYDVEATSYGLLTQLQLSKMDKSNSIINWLNTKQVSSGSFQSTQDTVVALQALYEYSIKARTLPLNLISNITSNNDRHFLKTFSFAEKNALVLQEYKVDKLGGMLFIKTIGQGVGLLSVKMQYNIPYPTEKLCKFDLRVNVSEEKEIEDVSHENQDGGDFGLLREDQIRGARQALDLPPPELEIDPRRRSQSRIGILNPKSGVAKIRRKREDKMNNSNLVLRLTICTSYLGDHEPGMTIVDVGIFSGFKVNEDDLKKLVNSPEHEMQRYDLSSRGVEFYLKNVPKQETYCFAFRIVRDYIVGNTQSSVVKVYAYYSPEESCTIFYSPDHNSPLLRKICSNGICLCAEGGCPPKNPFPKNPDRRELKLNACENNDYVWLVQVVDDVVRDNGFLNIKLRVVEVLKEGIEKASLIENKIRTFMARDNCESAALFPGKQYIIMGKDGKKVENDQSEIVHKYLFDKTSKIHIWTDVASSGNKQKLMSALHRLRGDLKKGCDL